MILEKGNLGTYSIVDMSQEELSILKNVINNGNLPDRRNLYNITKQIEKETN